MCEFKDKGSRPRTRDIVEVMRLNDGCSTSIISALVKKGYLKTNKVNSRCLYLIPLLRPDGRKYEPLAKINGVTVCEPAFAEGYGGL